MGGCGWIKLYRKIQESEMYKNLNSKQRDVMIQCLLLANHKGNKWNWGTEIYECNPGQFITSLESLSKQCASDVSIQNVRTALAKLEKWQFLTNRSTKTGRLITLINWELYQVDEKNQQTLQQTANNQLTTNKNDNNDKKNIDTNADDDLALLDSARILYPGSKRGAATEFKDLKKHKDWKETLPLLKPAIELQIKYRQQQDKKGEFVPNWKHLKTWISQRCWEEEVALENIKPIIKEDHSNRKSFYQTQTA